jgi:hypothetical protein
MWFGAGSNASKDPRDSIRVQIYPKDGLSTLLGNIDTSSKPHGITSQKIAMFVFLPLVSCLEKRE